MIRATNKEVAEKEVNLYFDTLNRRHRASIFGYLVKLRDQADGLALRRAFERFLDERDRESRKMFNPAEYR